MDVLMWPWCPVVSSRPGCCLAKGPGGLLQSAGSLTKQPAHHLRVINDFMLPSCQNGFSGERYNPVPCIAVCDGIDLILTLSRLSGLHSNRWPGGQHLPQSVSLRKRGSRLKKILLLKQTSEDYF